MGHILHFGLGNFARAHMLDYTSDAGGWEVTGVSLRSAMVRDQLAAQGYDYALFVQGVGAKQITILRDVLVAPEDPQAVLVQSAQADIISATVTEKGYYLDAAGSLDLGDPAICSDLAGNGPATLIGYLAHGLAGRSEPVTVLSCDNMVGNGAKLRDAVATFARSAGLNIDWAKVRFPNAMVDRITPATTDSLCEITGDAMAVPTEAFREWVVEDDFAGPRPDWPDVLFVTDVAPYELRKLRMLNGAHSLLAYAGLLRGHTFVHQAVSDPELRPLVKKLMAEAGATLPTQIQGQVPDYAEALLARFENPELEHRLDQIAMDGSQKLPYRFVATLRERHAPAVVKGLQSWFAFCVSESASGHALNDPKATEIAKATQAEDVTTALLEIIGAADLAPLIRG